MTVVARSVKQLRATTRPNDRVRRRRACGCPQLRHHPQAGRASTTARDLGSKKNITVVDSVDVISSRIERVRRVTRNRRRGIVQIDSAIVSIREALQRCGKPDA
jgi:hypothetical protein